MRKVSQFQNAATSLASIDAASAPSVIAAAADLTLVVDNSGVIQDIAFRKADIARAIGDAGSWQGRNWVDTVTVESRPKIKLLLNKAAEGDDKPRQVNHPSIDGADVPVEYSTVTMPQSGGVLAFGRDLRPLSTLQQRLVDAQQALDRDYATLRQAQTRYRVLFAASPDALFLVELPGLQVLEANPAAQAVLDLMPRPASALIADLFHADDRPTVLRLFATLSGGPEPGPIQVRLAGSPADTATLSVQLLLEQAANVLMVRLVSGRLASVDPVAADGDVLSMRVLAGLHAAPDAFVLTDTDGDVLDVNPAFLTMVQLSVADRARGRSLDMWLGQSGVDLNVLLANLRQRGSIRLFTTVVRGEHGAVADVEVSAGAGTALGQPCFAFILRDVARRLQTATDRPPALSRSIEQLTELIGRVTLKELVRDATDVIERLCIEAALELTGNNRASAAEMLGLSRQSLYVKLRRYDLGGDPDPEDDGDDQWVA